MQGTSYRHYRFIDINVRKLASTSNYLTFCASFLLEKLIQPEFVTDSLTLFGDNAYVNTDSMTTSFKSVSDGILDEFNDYHSQVCISIEYTFGVFIHR